MLSTLGQQLDRIENISNTKIEEASTSASTSQSKRIEIEENPIFIPYSIDTPINIGEQESILKEINEKLLKLNINNINEDDITDHDMTDLEEQFKDNFEINKIKYNTYVPTAEARNYYHRPTPPDMGFEERNSLSQAHGTEIYEWNIDGQTEHQISNLLQEMTMAANAYKAHKNNELQIVQHLIAGFTGTLKGLKKNPKPWTEEHTKIVKTIKDKIKELPCLNIPHPEASLIVETDASDIGYGGDFGLIGDETDVGDLLYKRCKSVLIKEPILQTTLDVLKNKPSMLGLGCDILPPLKELCTQSLRRGRRVNENMRVFFLHLVFALPRKLGTSSGIPTDLHNWNVALL
ncbi:MP domain-containing protein [Tanacetum coccineum]